MPVPFMIPAASFPARAARTRLVEDLDECRALWERFIPSENIWDLWEVREAFHRAFQRRACFVVIDENSPSPGFLPLSLVEETGVWQYFPGETWGGRTWLEQNRLIAVDETMIERLVQAAPGPVHLRYLSFTEAGRPARCEVDEMNYRFHPARHDFDFDRYFATLSRKMQKTLRREEAALLASGFVERAGDEADFAWMIEVNLERFGARCYYHDSRFREGFRNLFRLLRARGWLRLVTLELGGEPAAVDLTALFRGVCTVFAGGARRDHLSAGRVINLQHLRRACRERYEAVDFLCGDFSWKERFRLSARPLHRLSTAAPLATAH